MNTDAILQLASFYQLRCQGLIKFAKIRKLPNGKYRVLSQQNKNLGTFKSKDLAKKRLKQVEYFKHFDHNKIEDQSSIIDLTDIDEFAYSAIMRKLRQKANSEQIKYFLKLFKKEFDKAIKGKLHNPEKIALQNTMVKYNKIYKIKLNAKMIKLAAIAELGNAEQVGKYLSDIVKFTLQRLPPDKYPQALDRMKTKFHILNENEISSKHLPNSSALGQAITFVKHVLFNHDAHYVRQVLDSLVRSL